MTACATRRRAWSRPARRPSTTSARSRRPTRHTVIFKMKAVNASMLEHFASPWNVIYCGEGPRRRSERPEDQDQRHRPVHLRRARQGQPRRPASATRTTSRRACPISTASRACSRCRPPRCSTRVQGGQVLGEFRGISPAERDRLVQAMGDKIRIEESSWTLNLLVCLQHREEAVRRRARAQGAADGDRPLGRQPGPFAHLDACARSAA